MTADQLQLFGRPRIARRGARQTNRALEALRARTGLSPESVGQVAMLRTVADLLDREISDPEGSAFTAARLVTEWRALWAELTGRREAGLDDELRAFFDGADAAGGPTVRDSPEP